MKYLRWFRAIVILVILILIGKLIDPLGNSDDLTQFKKPAVERPQLVKDDAEKMKLEDFKKLVDQTLKELPTEAVVKFEIAKSQAHHIPDCIIEAAYKIKTVADLIQKEKSFKKVGMEFYKKCAHQPDGVDAIRIQCMSRFLQMKADLAKVHPKALDLNRRLSQHQTE